jgi:hypothetical protein
VCLHLRSHSAGYVDDGCVRVDVVLVTTHFHMAVCGHLFGGILVHLSHVCVCVCVSKAVAVKRTAAPCSHCTLPRTTPPPQLLFVNLQSVYGVPILLCINHGDYGRQLERLPDSQVASIATEHLRRMFGDS